MTPASLHLRYQLDQMGPTPAALPAGTRFVRFEPAHHARPARFLLNAAYREGGGRVEEFDAWWPRLVADEEYDPALCFVVSAASDDALIGFAHCWTGAFIKDIAVALDWRNSGVGTALMQQIFQTFRARGAGQVELKVEASNPHGAISFYRKLGMKPA
ncbi:GNAT family N-acetyltransferase [Maricaulis sp.]|uniref:GNAT family N-acetyltransferase n=1 Tax=Maricaulis sp. TaxID=1486257 RepID=UPI002603F56A|nr:GNAT family N-acetyltransferase [Maricaulis sp.]